MKRYLYLIVVGILLLSGRVFAADSVDWAALTPAQREVLAPMAQQWASLPSEDQQRFSAMATRLPKMPPEKQTGHAS